MGEISSWIEYDCIDKTVIKKATSDYLMTQFQGSHQKTTNFRLSFLEFL